MIYFGAIGLIMNFVGTIMIAFSFGSNPGGGYQTDTRGQRIYLASFLRPKLFWFGLALIALGFLCQLIPEGIKLLRMISIAIAD